MIAEPKITEIQAEIAAANDEFMAAVKRGDAAALASFYTTTGKLLPPNSDFMIGREAIQGFWQAVINMGVKAAQMDIVEVEKCADTVIEMSTFKMFGEAGQELDRGKYIVIWKKEDGHWRLHRDIFNSSKPAAS